MSDYEADAALVAALKFTPLDWSAEPEDGMFYATGVSGCTYEIFVDEDGEFSLTGDGLRPIPSFATCAQAKMRANRIEAQRQNRVADFFESKSVERETEINRFLAEKE